ncbi:hypothetical protein ACWERV_02960 [Streptomyces sp. NPDC004031]
MGDMNINGPIIGPSQFGENNTQYNVAGQAASAAAALALADALVGQLGRTPPAEAVAVRAELARAAESGGEPDHQRVRAWLATLAAAVGTGSGALALVEQLRQVVG